MNKTVRTEINRHTRVEMTFEDGSDPISIKIESDRGLQNQHMRAVAWGELIAHMREQARQDEVDPELRKLVARALAKPLDAYKPHHRWVVVSAAYVLEHQGGSARPLQAVQEATGGSLESIRTWVRQCRKIGLLTRTPPGVGGGSLTDQGWEMLREAVT